MINDLYYKRRYVISGIAVVIVLVYIIRLFYLQIIDQSTKDQADNNALVKQTIYPSRGLIYDRNGELLVFNQPPTDLRSNNGHARHESRLGHGRFLPMSEDQPKGV